MNIIDLRRNLLTTPVNERSNDRRKNPYPFGSDEWLDYIQKQGLNRPAYDRRKVIRRAGDRRTQNENQHAERPYTRILLTPAEKKLLTDIYLAE